MRSTTRSVRRLPGAQCAPGLALAATLCACAAQPVKPAPVPTRSSAELAALIEASDYIFEGTIQKLPGSTVEQVPASGDVAVLRVDDVIDSAPSFPDFLGREITVRLTAGQQAAVGQKRVFFTRSWLFAKSLAVDEVGVEGGTSGNKTPSGELRGLVRKIRAAAAENAVRRRLQAAEVVVSGTVVRTAPLPKAWSIASEHDPSWTAGFVRVDRWLKGKQESRELRFLFAASEDVHWYRVPKTAANQRAVFVMQRANRSGWSGAEGLTELVLVELYPIEREAETERLLRR